MARIILVFLIVATSALQASAAERAASSKNELYKCVSGTGVVSIQSEPCASGSTQAWRRLATPEPVLTPEQQAQADAQRLRDQQRVRELSDIVDKKLRPPAEPAKEIASPRPENRPEAVRDACQEAQNFAGELREKEWLGLTEDQVRRLYGWVADQCKVPSRAD